MPEWAFIVGPVLLSSLLALLGALLLELRNHRDRLIRIETYLERLPCALCEVTHGVSPAPGMDTAKWPGPKAGL